MALIHDAELSPTKQELLADWVPTRPWSGGAAVEGTIGSYRFDDADGEVGLETFLLRAGGTVLQVPLSYRPAPLDGAGDRLVTTIEHSVLGRRHVYDAVGDPTYVRELTRAVLDGAAGAPWWVHRDDADPELVDAPVHVRGSGDGSAALPSVGSVSAEDDGHTSVVRAGALRLAVARTVATSGAGAVGADHFLRGTWPGQDDAVVLAVLLEGLG